MTGLIRSIYIDLRNRLSKMIDHLDTLSMEAPSASEFKQETVVKLTLLRNKIFSCLESGILEEDFFIPNNIINYNSLNNEFLEIELFRYLPISKYDIQAEGYFDKVIQSIYSEINCSQSVPFISTMSNSDAYYWAYSKYKMIALPQGEEKHLLNLGDLYHEIGHLIFIQSETFLIGEHLDKAVKHFNRLTGNVKKRTNARKRSKINNAKVAWENTWSEELACDLIATYLVGPAYAWSHMKLCAVSSGFNNLYSNNHLFKEHPPDEVRMRVILKMLEKIGCDKEKNCIEKAWLKFLEETHNDKPADYDILFPDELMISITDNVFDSCKFILLHSYPEQKDKNTRPISLIINEAWLIIRDDPASFGDWEVQQISDIRQRAFI